MSRNIPSKNSVPSSEEMEQRKTDSGKLLFTAYKNKNCALYIRNNRLMAASFFPEKSSRIGAIYIGKIKNIVKNIDACFLEIAENQICFLSLKDMSVPYLLNRKYNGKLIEGDEMLVQVVRDAQKGKNATVTSRVSLANDYFSLEIGMEKVRFSLKLSQKKKDLTKEILTQKGIIQNDFLVQTGKTLLSALKYNSCKREGIDPESFQLPPVSCIVRTKAGELESESELLEKFHSIGDSFFQILYTSKYRNCFSCLKDAPSEFETILQQLPETDIGGISISSENRHTSNIPPLEAITDKETIKIQLEKYCAENNMNFPIRLYQDDLLPLSVLYSVESRLKTALDNRVWLKSGAYLVIEHTEALTVIDVNSGKCAAGKNSRESYLNINLEAAEEIMLQLRLRNLSGIIVVDFINMKLPCDKQELLCYLKSLAANDRIPTKIVDMTPLGLVEITRKKISKPLREQILESYILK